MQIKIEMTDEIPEAHGDYFVIPKRGERSLLKCRIFQDFRDYFPTYTIEGKEFTRRQIEGLYWFSKEPVVFSAFLSQGNLLRSLI